jgi:hypothetical protein
MSSASSSGRNATLLGFARSLDGRNPRGGQGFLQFSCGSALELFLHSDV